MGILHLRVRWKQDSSNLSGICAGCMGSVITKNMREREGEGEGDLGGHEDASFRFGIRATKSELVPRHAYSLPSSARSLAAFPSKQR